MTSGRSEWLMLRVLRWGMFALLVVLLSVMSGVVGFGIGGGGEDGGGTTSPAQDEADFGILDEIYGTPYISIRRPTLWASISSPASSRELALVWSRTRSAAR